MKKKLRRSLYGWMLLFTLPGLVSCQSGDSSSADVFSEEYRVTLDFEDGISRDRVLYVKKGESVTLPQDVRREGYAFVGWKEGENLLSSSFTPTSDVTLTAQWKVGTCKVTFHANYEGGEDATVSADYGSFVTEAPALTRPGYVFRYWMALPEGEEVDLATYPIKGDYDFYASWRNEAVQELEVTIHAGVYEDAPEDIVLTLDQGESIKKSNSALKVSRTGYKLEGWTLLVPNDGSTYSIDESPARNLPALVSFPFKPQESCTLYAVWTIETYSVIWNYNYTDAPTKNGVYQVDKILSKDSVTKPATDPIRTDYSFAGWFTASSGGSEVDFSQDIKITHNTGYYAHWTHDQVTTDTFQAEYVSFDPTKEYWGYSGSVRGPKCIVKDGGSVGTVSVDDYPLNSVLKSHEGYYVSYQYEKGDTLTFHIIASEATTATLKGAFAVENSSIGSISSSGDNSTLIKVNGTSIDYSLSLTMTFAEYTIGTVSLKQGSNTIEIIVNNDNKVLGGTYRAVSFNTDYLKLEGATGSLSWSPVYDNLEKVQ